MKTKISRILKPKMFYFLVFLVSAHAQCMEHRGVLVKIDPATTLYKPDRNGRTPLHHAVRDVDLLRVFIAHGALVNAQDNNGYTPLHCAAAGDKPLAVEYLLSERALPDLPDNKGVTPLYLASIFCGDAISMLVDAGAQVNTQDPKTGCTPLHNACNYRYPIGGSRPDKGIIALLRAGACINIRDRWKNLPSFHGDFHILNQVYSPFYDAVRANNLAKAQEFIAQGVDVNTTYHARLQDGHALKLALENNLPEMTCLLLDNGAKPQQSSFKYSSKRATLLLMTHVPPHLIKEQWHYIGMTLLCWRACSLPVPLRKIIIYHATKDAIIAAMVKRAQQFCVLQQEAHAIDEIPPFNVANSELYNPLYNANNVSQYLPQWIAQINKAAYKKNASS